MRTFAKPNYSNWQVCPICKKDSDWEIILVPILWTEEWNLSEAAQVHTACIQDRLVYDVEHNILHT